MSRSPSTPTSPAPRPSGASARRAGGGWRHGGRDRAGHVQVAFDANEPCAKAKRGFRAEGEWLVCNKCDKSFRLAEVNAGGGGCKPVPLEHRVSGDELVIAEADILAGWRLFRRPPPGRRGGNSQRRA